MLKGDRDLCTTGRSQAETETETETVPRRRVSYLDPLGKTTPRKRWRSETRLRSGVGKEGLETFQSAVQLKRTDGVPSVVGPYVGAAYRCIDAYMHVCICIRIPI